MMKLYIGNLSYDTTDEELQALLAPHEPIVEIRRPQDHDTGKPRGFAFVTFGSRDAGEQALEALNGLTVGGRELNVSEAEERRASPNPERRGRVSMNVELTRSVDDRPIGPDGKRVRYKGI